MFLVVLLLAVTVVGTAATLGSNIINNEKNAIFADKWQYSVHVSVEFLLMLVFLFAKGQESKASITNLGAFFVCAGYWVLVESKMMQFIFPYPTALTNSSIFSLTLLPIFSGLYYYHTHTKVYKKVGKCVVAICSFGN